MKSQFSSLVLCATLVACGDSDNQPTPAKAPSPIPQDQQGEPVKRTSVTVTATAETKGIALRRLELLKEITAVLESLRDPQVALTHEEELRELFSEYNQLGEQAAEQGLKGRPLAALTAHLAPDEWRDIRAEFQQYMLLIKQHGAEQREMMERVMAEGLPETAGDAQESPLVDPAPE